MTNLTKLMAEIDKADADLDFALNEEAAATRKREMAEATSLALHRALILIESEEAKPEEPAKQEKPPRELCADAIEHQWRGDLPDFDVAVSHLNDRFNPRTIRSGLNIAHERRKKSGASEPPPPSHEASGHSHKAAPEPVPEIPVFLDRRRESA